MELSFLEFAEEILQRATKPMTYQEIYDDGVRSGLVAQLATQGKTPWQTLGARLYVDTKKKAERSRFVQVGQNPARFFLRARKNELTPEVFALLERSEQADELETYAPYHERELHPLLASFVYTNLGFNRGRSIYSKQSSTKNQSMIR